MSRSSQRTIQLPEELEEKINLYAALYDLTSEQGVNTHYANEQFNDATRLD